MTTAAEPAPAETGPGLYVHVPFCESKCGYCDFYSVTDEEAPNHRFAAALAAEAQLRVPPGFRPRTVFVGGGTPTVLPPAMLEEVLSTVRAISVDRGQVVEWSVESNPRSLTAERIALMREAGVTRLSIGVQSFDDDVLRALGRVHDAATARRAVELARESGIPQISLDLLFAVPGQTIETFRRDLQQAVALGTDHVSVYALIYEDGTPMTRARDRGELVATGERVELQMMRTAHRVLRDAGFLRYEVSSFAPEGRECLHNVNYWRNGTYLGLGPSAATYVDRRRSTNARSWSEWERRVLSGVDPVAFSERLDPARAAAEELMLRLRTARGVRLDDLAVTWGSAAVEPFGALFARFEQAGLAVRTRVDAGADGAGPGSWVLTDSGFEVADGIIAEFIAAAGDGD